VRPRWAVIAFAVISALATSAHADLVDVPWQADATAQGEWQIAPGKFAEWCTQLRQGEKVQWRFDADAPLNFNVHYHEGKEVRVPAKQDAASKSEGLLDVPSDQHYCWMWSNKSKAAVTARATLRKVP
jgi:hypothetical protein